MADDSYMVFEGFGTSGTMSTRPHQDETIIANWANMLADEVFNDPDCKWLQVNSIVRAIKEIGFPNEYASKVRLLEQQLDPKNEDITVDKPTLKRVARLWLKLCHDETDVEECTVVNLNSIRDVHQKSQARFYDVDQDREDDSYKNEISGLHSTLSAYEEKMKILLRDTDALKKSVKSLKVAIRKAEEDKVLAEESKATVEETLRVEKLMKSKEVTALDKQLTLAHDQLESLVKENLGYNCVVKDLEDELVLKSNELEEMVRENGVLKVCLEQLEERLQQAENEITQLTNTNFELVEHGEEWKKTIQNLRDEKNALSKKLLLISSRNKTGKDASNSNSDFGSDSSSVGELSIFSPGCFSSPLESEKLSVELAETSFDETVDSESASGTPTPLNNPTEGTGALIPKQKRMRKRKLFPVPTLESKPDPKRNRSHTSEQTPTAFDNSVRGSALATLPLERSTSFAINLTVHQKLLESLRQALCLYPHLFGCLRDFVAWQVPNSMSGTELTHTDLTSLFYEFCTARLSMPFRGRQFLRVICEEPPTQVSSSALERCHVVDQPNCDEPSEYTQASSYIFEFENSVGSKMVQTMYPLAITEGQGLGLDSVNSDLVGQHANCSDEFTLLANTHNLKCTASEFETITSAANLQASTPSSFGEDKSVEIPSISDAAGNCTELPSTLECNESYLELELVPLDNMDSLVPKNRETSEQSDPVPLDTLICVNLTGSQESNAEDFDEEQAVGCVDDVTTDMSANNVDLLCSTVTEMTVESLVPLPTVISAPALVTDAVDNETQHSDVGNKSSDNSNKDVSQSVLIEPSFELYSNRNSEQRNGCFLTDMETPDLQLDCIKVSPNGKHSNHDIKALVSSDLASPVYSPYEPVVKQVPRRRFKFMIKFTVFICFSVLFLFSALTCLAKCTLPEKEFTSLLLALDGKYDRHETQLY